MYPSPQDLLARGIANRHCLVCGSTEGKHLLHCVHCARSYHAVPCANPSVPKPPRGRWTCHFCQGRTPRYLLFDCYILLCVIKILSKYYIILYTIKILSKYYILLYAIKY